MISLLTCSVFSSSFLIRVCMFSSMDLCGLTQIKNELITN